MTHTVAQPADSSAEPALSDRDKRITAAVERLVAFRAARGRGYQ